MRDVDIDVDAEGFAVQTEKCKATPEPLIVPPATSKRLPLLRGFNDCRGQQIHFPDMEVARAL